MSINGGAQQLLGVVESVPVGQNQAVIASLESLQANVVAILEGTPSQAEIVGVIQKAMGQAASLGGVLAHLSEVITTSAQYHQRG